MSTAEALKCLPMQPRVWSARFVSPLRSAYPRFFWSKVNPYIGDALDYLRVTQEGKFWIASLYAHVFSEEHRSAIRTR